MKLLLALSLLILSTACSHPLEIVGDGDIHSSNDQHNCLLEETPCANYVAGNYTVTYTAQPRAGWFFSEWKGCGTQHPDWSFNISGSVVNQFLGQTMPALLID